MADQDIERAADQAAGDQATEELVGQLARVICEHARPAGDVRPPCAAHQADARALLPVVRAYAAARVELDRQRRRLGGAL